MLQVHICMLYHCKLTKFRVPFIEALAGTVDPLGHAPVVPLPALPEGAQAPGSVLHLRVHNLYVGVQFL